MNSTTNADSVIISLAQLEDLGRQRANEDRRMREAARRAECVAKAAREATAVRAARRAKAASNAMAADRRRAQAETAARESARCQARVEVARIEAEGKVRLAAQDAMRRHELSVIRVTADRARARLRRALAAVVGVVMIAGPGAAFAMNGQVTALEHQVHPLVQDRVQMVVQQHVTAPAPELTDAPIVDVDVDEQVNKPAPPTPPRWVAPSHNDKQTHDDQPKVTCLKGDPLCSEGKMLTQ